MQRVITNLDELKKELFGQVARCLAFFPDVDRTVGGYEGLIASQDCLPDNDTRGTASLRNTPCSHGCERRFLLTPALDLMRQTKWLTQVYESVKPVSGHGKLLWHALGAKTIEPVHRNVHLEMVRDDLETLVMDAHKSLQV